MESEAPLTNDHLAARLDKIERILGELAAKKPEQKKDLWDRFSSISGLVSGIVVALIGTGFTYVYNVRTEQRDAQTKEQQERLQELQTIVQFMPYLIGHDENAQKYAITAIQTLANTKIATELAKLNPSEGIEAGVAAIAANASNPADRRLAESALTQIRCGAERWAIKTLTDAENSQVNLHPEAATIDQLRSIERPQEAPRAGSSWGTRGVNRLDIEKRTYVVRARLTAVKQEMSSDYKLILADPTDPNHTLTAKIPAPECAAQSPFRAQFLEARETVSKLVGAAPKHSSTQTNVEVEVRGVGYFAGIHGQKDLAPNGFELHPVLSITILAAPRATQTQ